MKINKAHCFFEQSGTFKNEFIKLGVPAEDYDIQNEFGQTDHVVDLFAEIRGGYEGKLSIFDNIGKGDLIFAFFPCTYFETKSQMIFRGVSYGMDKYSTKKRVEISKERHKQLAIFYEKLCELVVCCIDKEIPLIIENPRTPPHYLNLYWCVEPKIIDIDRTLNGDYYKKPTQYWCFNFTPENNLVFEPIDYVKTATVDSGVKIDGIGKTTARSMIHPQYASRFIKQYLIDYEPTFDWSSK